MSAPSPFAPVSQRCPCGKSRKRHHRCSRPLLLPRQSERMRIVRQISRFAESAIVPSVGLYSLLRQLLWLVMDLFLVDGSGVDLPSESQRLPRAKCIPVPHKSEAQVIIELH